MYEEKVRVKSQLHQDYPDAEVIEVHTLKHGLYAVELWHDVESGDVERFFVSSGYKRHGE